MTDNQKYRVTLLSNAAWSEGYGPTVERARENARAFFLKTGTSLRDVSEEVTEHVVPTSNGGSRYAEV